MRHLFFFSQSAASQRRRDESAADCFCERLDSSEREALTILPAPQTIWGEGVICHRQTGRRGLEIPVNENKHLSKLGTAPAQIKTIKKKCRVSKIRGEGAPHLTPTRCSEPTTPAPVQILAVKSHPCSSAHSKRTTRRSKAYKRIGSKLAEKRDRTVKTAAAMRNGL